MVQVPIFQEPQQAGALPAFGAPGVIPQRDATGQQLQQLGAATLSAATATANIADVLQDDVDDAKKKEAATLWDEENRNTLYEPETGYMNQLGKAATKEARIIAQNKMAVSAQQFSKNLDNDTQRALFGQLVQTRTIQIGQQMFQHEAQQTKVYATGEAKAAAETFANNAVDIATTPLDPLIPDAIAQRAEAFQSSLLASVTETMKVAELLGLGPDATERMVLDVTSGIHVDVVDRFVKEKNPDFAAIYLQQVPDNQITPQDRTRLQGLVTTATLQDRAFDQASEIIEKVDRQSETLIQQSPGSMDPSLALRLNADDRLVMALAELRSMDMPAVMRDATRQRLERAYGERATAEAVAVANVVERSMQALTNDLKMGVIDLPPQDIEELRRSGRLTAMNTFANSGRFGGNPQQHARIMSLSRVDMQAQWPDEQKLRLHALDLGMNVRERQGVAAAWDAAHAAPNTPIDRVLTIQAMILDLGNRHGLVDDKGNITNLPIYNAIKDDANDRLLQVEGVKGRQVGQDLKDVLNQAFIDGFVTLDPGVGYLGLPNERLVLRSQLTQAELTNEDLSIFSLQAEAFRDIKLRDRDETTARIALPVHDWIVRDLRAADPPKRVTLATIFKVWDKLGQPSSVSEILNR